MLQCVRRFVCSLPARARARARSRRSRGRCEGGFRERRVAAAKMFARRHDGDENRCRKTPCAMPCTGRDRARVPFRRKKTRGEPSRTVTGIYTHTQARAGQRVLHFQKNGRISLARRHDVNPFRKTAKVHGADRGSDPKAQSEDRRVCRKSETNRRVRLGNARRNRAGSSRSLRIDDSKFGPSIEAPTGFDDLEILPDEKVVR